jgi:hypothetical protein
MLALIVLMELKAVSGRHTTIYLEPADGRLCATLRMGSDGFSRVGGVHALVVDEREGMLDITYQNNLQEHAIVHIHGINPQENQDGQDGFPFFKSWLIPPGHAKHVQYPLQQSGTYFLHSHINMQQERGLVMPLIIREVAPPAGHAITKEFLHGTHDALLLLQEHCPYFSEDPAQGQRSADQPDRVMKFMKQDWDDIESMLEDTFEQCSEQADSTDVLFLHHLINGEQHYSVTLPRYSIFPPKPEPVRVRILNAGSMTNYKVYLPSNSTIIKADGSWVEPFTPSGENPYVWVGVGQRYEVLVEEVNAFTIYAVAESFAREPLPHEIATMHIQVSDDISPGSTSASRDSIETPQDIGMATGNADDSIDNVLAHYPPHRVDFSDAINRTYRITGAFARSRSHSLARTHALACERRSKPGPYSLIARMRTRRQQSVNTFARMHTRTRIL